MFDAEPTPRANPTERLLHLRSFSLFADLPPRVLQALAGAVTVRTFDPGETIFRRGSPYEHAALVTHGRPALAGADAASYPLPPKPCLGLMGLLARAECAHDVVAQTEVRSLLLAGETLFELLEDHSALLRAVTRHLARLGTALASERPSTLDFMAKTSAISSPISVSAEPLNPIERISFLRKQPVFASTNLASLVTLSRLMREVRFRPGEPIWRIGDPSETNFTVVDGTIEGIFQDGRRVAFGPGSPVGGVEGLANRPRWYDAVAATPVVAFEGRTDEFVELLEDDFGMAAGFLEAFAGGLIAAMGLESEPRRDST